MRKILLWCCVLMLPSLLHAQNLTVSGDYDNQSLQQIFNDLSSRYPVSFFYKKEDLPSKKTTISFENQPINAAVQQLLDNTNLTFATYREYAFIVASKAELDREFTQEFYVAQEKAMLDAAKIKDTEKEIPLTTIGSANTMNQSGTAMLSGYILGVDNDETQIGATIFVKELNKGTSSDVNGRYEIELPIGTYTLAIKSIGYLENLQQITIYQDGTLDIGLYREAVDLTEIVVEGEALDANVKSSQIGVEKLSTKEIKKLPAFMGEADVVKSLILLPGVSNVGEGAGGFNVRGGTVDQNLIMQDGGFVFNSSHVLGFFSTFNADMVKNLTLYKGNIPAQYGGRLSSVLDVEMKDGNYHKFIGKGGIGLIATRLSFEGPIQKGKSSFIIGGRSTYSDWILQAINIPEVQNSSAFFYDVNAKFTQKFDDNSKISLSTYLSQDRFKFNNEFEFDWATQMVNGEWTQFYSSELSSSLNVVYSKYSSTLADPEGNQAFSVDNASEYVKVKPNFVYNPNANHNINAGVEGIYYIINPGSLTPVGEVSSILPRNAEAEQGLELAAYLNDEIIVNDDISISAGLRYSFYQNRGAGMVFQYADGQPKTLDNLIDTTTYGSGEAIVNYGGLEPRVSVKIGTSLNSSIKLSYNRTRQYINLISNTAAATPIDVWQLSNPHVPPQVADNYSIGYFLNLQDNIYETSLELYYRDIQQLVEYRDLADLLVNNHIETELLIGEGRAYGAELSLRRKIGRLNGWISYTYSRSQRKVQGETLDESVNLGEWFPSNYDKPHDLTLVTTYQISRRSSVTFNFTYNTGRPTSAPVGKYAVDNALNIPNYSYRNQFRIPDYHRLDVSYTLDTGYKKEKAWESSWTFSIYNLYGRRNAYSVYFTQQPFQNPKANRLSVIGSAFPALTYNFKF